MAYQKMSEFTFVASNNDSFDGKPIILSRDIRNLENFSSFRNRSTLH